jgi:hypothetical protein
MPYTLEAGRQIVGPSGLKLATLHRVEIPEREHPDGASGAYTISPYEADRFARQIVDALNADPRRPDLRSLAPPLGMADSYVRQCVEELGGADPVAALIAAALDLYGAGFGSKSQAARDAHARLGSAMVVINGAPLMFRGDLNPDGPEYGPTVDARAAADIAAAERG